MVTKIDLTVGHTYTLDNINFRLKRLNGSLGIFQELKSDGSDNTDGLTKGSRIIFSRINELKKQRDKDMKKKSNFGMWIFSDGVMKTLNWIAVILIIVWFGYHGLRFVFGF